MKYGDRPGTLTIVTYASVLLVLWGAPFLQLLQRRLLAWISPRS
jgi:hypothetical protein